MRPLVTLGSLLLSAYFLAQGVTTHLAHAWLEPRRAIPFEAGRPVVAREPKPQVSLAPLFPSPGSPATGGHEDDAAPRTCEGWRLVGVVQGASAVQLASVAHPDGRVRVHRLGAGDADGTLTQLDAERVIWTRPDGDRCGLSLFDHAEPPVASERPVRDVEALPVRRVAPGVFAMPRAAIEDALTGRLPMLRSVDVRPVREGGRTRGVRLRQVPAALAALGIEAGDILREVGGHEFTPDGTIAILAALRSERELPFVIERNGRRERQVLRLDD